MPTVHQRYRLFSSLALALLVVFQTAGWLVAWQGLVGAAKLQAHRAISNGLHPTAEQAFSRHFFQKHRVGRRELLLNGQLYDYAVVAQTDDSVRVRLYHDLHEQELWAKFAHVFDNSGGDWAARGGQLARWLAQSIGTAYVVPCAVAFCPLPGRLALLAKLTGTQRLLCPQAKPEVCGPPPKKAR